MPEEQPDTAMDDYLTQVEQHEFIKREGIAAYAELIISALGDKIDDDKKILVKQGLTEMLAGPPRFPPCPPAKLTPSPEIDAAFVDPIFEQTDTETGVTRIYDWISIAAESTHCERGPSRVTLYHFDEILMTLKGEAADAFWKWSEDMRKGVTIPARIVRRRNRPNPRRNKT